MFGNLISTIAQKLGLQSAPTPAPVPAQTPVNPKNEMVPPAVKLLQGMQQNQAKQAAITPPAPPANSFISTLNNKLGLLPSAFPAPLKSLPEPTADQINAAQTSERQTLQGVPRGFYRFGASTASALASAIGNPAPASVAPPTGVFGRTFLGTEPIDTYQTEYAKEKTASEASGVPSYVVKPLAILSVAGESAGDLLGMLPEGEAGKALLGKQTDQIVSSLTAETDAGKASQTLKAANISPDIADKYAPQFAATTTPAETKTVLKSVASDQIQKTTDDATERLGQLKEKAETAVLTPDELAEQTFLSKNIKNPAQLFTGYRTSESMAEVKTENGTEGANVRPDGFRPVQKGEILPNGYTTKMDVNTGEQLTNAPTPDMQNNAKYNVERGVPKESEPGSAKTETAPISKIIDSEDKVVYDAKGKETEPKMDGGETPATPAKIKTYNKFRQDLSDRWTKVVENFQNNKNRVEKLVNSSEAKVTVDTDPALAHTLYSGRLDTRMRAVQDELASVVDKTVANAKSAKVGYQSFKDDVNDYLHSLHAPERNAALGENAAGITDEEAAKMQAELKAKPHFAQIKEVGDQLLEMNRKTLDTLYQDGAKHGVIDKDTYDMLREKYQNHVPLNRVFGEGDNISDVLTGRGFDVRGSGLRTAKGSAREVADIYTNITSNLASAVQRVEKNLVDNATYDFVKANGEEMGFGHVLKNAPTSTSDPRILQLRVNGQDAWIKFEDAAVADQFKSVGNEHLPTLLKFIDTFTRFYSSLATRFNPEFVFSNKMRDLQEAMVYAGSEGKLNSGATGVLKREITFQNERAVLDHMRGIDSSGARAYQSMLDNGGATGGMALSTRGQIESNLADIERLAQSKPRQALQAVVHKIDQANEVFENSTRLSVYREALAQGVTEKEAAAMAKESTVNFNRKGKFGSVINSLYMFSNASLQGSVKMLRAMRDPKVLAATALTVGGSVFLTNKHNDAIDPNWRDKVSTFDRESNMVVVVQGGDQDFKYVTIPVSYALKPFKVAFDGAYDLASGNKGTQAKNVLESTVAAVVNGYNPVGGTDLGSALTPTIADVPREIGVNKSWTGSKIRPDDNADLPASRQYFDSLKDTPTGRAMIALTKTLSDHHIAEISPANMAYAISQYAGGAGQFVSKVFNTVENSIEGQPTKPADIPFVSRFYKDVSGDELDARQQQNGNDGAMIKDLKEQGAAATFDKNEYVKDQIASIKAMKTPEEKSAAVDKILTDHPEMVQTILDQVKTDAKSYSTKEIEGLQVANGERAKFIVQKMATLTTSQEKAAFIDQLASDNLLTPQVVQQISALKGQESQ